MTFICKNACSRKDGIGRSYGHEKPDNWRMPFLSHGRCRTCQAWQRRTIGIRCICCGSIISCRPKESKKTEKYRELKPITV